MVCNMTSLFKDALVVKGLAKVVGELLPVTRSCGFFVLRTVFIRSDKSVGDTSNHVPTACCHQGWGQWVLQLPTPQHSECLASQMHAFGGVSAVVQRLGQRVQAAHRLKVVPAQPVLRR